MSVFYQWREPRKTKGIRLAVMDMWKPCRNATRACAPQAAIGSGTRGQFSHCSIRARIIRPTVARCNWKCSAISR